MFSSEVIENMPVLGKETGAELLRVVVTKENILTAIKRLREDSAPGPDGISPKLLKLAAHELVRPLAIIYRKSLASSVVPEDWRTATVVPIFKKGPKGDPGN